MLSFRDFALTDKNKEKPIELVLLSKKAFRPFKKKASEKMKTWLDNIGFSADPDQVEEWRNTNSQISHNFVTINTQDDFVKNPYNYVYALSGKASVISPETYAFSKKTALTPQQKYNLLLGWGLGAYRFDKYKKRKSAPEARLVIPEDVDKEELRRTLSATYMVQDMINEPAAVMSPNGLSDAAKTLAQKFNASCREIKGTDLTEKNKNFPLVYAVGKAAKEKPRVVDILWGDPKAPLITLVGKGVTHDSGGLNAKDDEEMQHMKNDMAGAAHALGLAYMIMDAKLPVRLRVLLPIVENAGGPNAYKQGDILNTRKGETLEVVHTDAEGRLILSDVLYEAAHPENPKNKPDMIIDFATLSWFGLAEFPGWGTVFSNNKKLQKEFIKAKNEQQEYFEKRPFLNPLMRELENSDVADIRQANENNAEYDDILAALLLKRQVGNDVPWLHLDLHPWKEDNGHKTQYPPNMPNGGFAMGLRSAYAMIKKKYIPQ